MVGLKKKMWPWKKVNRLSKMIAGMDLHQSQQENPIPQVMAIPVVEFSREGYKIRQLFG